MIQDAEINSKAKELGISARNVQKDYIFGWILSGIFSQSALGNKFILKGGNGVRKGYLLDSRFSKDLDFSIQDQIDPFWVKNELKKVTQFVEDRTGVKFEEERTKVEEKLIINNQQVYEGKVYFKSFYGEEIATLKIQLDLTEFDKIFLPIQSQSLIHPYSDASEAAAIIKCQKLEEILASKLNSLLHRRKVADLFDLVYSVLINNTFGVNKGEVVSTFLKKTIFESDPNAAKQQLLGLNIEESRPFWQEVIAPVASLFNFDQAISNFRVMVTDLFGLLPAPAIYGGGMGVGGGFSLPRVHQGITGGLSYFASDVRNKIISAGQSLTLIELLYDGFWREVEPYAFEYLVRKKDGVGVEFFWGFDRSGGKSGKISTKRFTTDKIQEVNNTNQSFSPQWQVEL